MKRFLMLLVTLSLFACGGATTETSSGQFTPTDDESTPTDPGFTRGDAIDFIDELNFYVGQTLDGVYAGTVPTTGTAPTHPCPQGGSMTIEVAAFDTNTGVGAFFIAVDGCAFDESSANGDLLWQWELFDQFHLQPNNDIAFEGDACNLIMDGAWDADDVWDFCDGRYIITTTVNP